MPGVSAEQLRRARMGSLLLSGPRRRTPLEVVEWFGAMQAQDVASGHWSLGVRVSDATNALVGEAFEAGELVRTWPVRGTIHIVPARDVSWLLDLTGSRMLANSERRRVQLGLTLADAQAASRALGERLANDRIVTRREALQTIADAGVDVGGQRGYHLLWYAAQSGVICIGPQRGADQTFVALADWAPAQVQLSREDALAELFHRFIRSHGPVSLRDFVGWTGLTLTDARRAANANAGRIEPIATESGDLWATAQLAEVVRGSELPQLGTLALPGFDEFLLGFKDRSLQLPSGAMERVVPGNNGMFRATVVTDGRVVATWTRTIKGPRVVVVVDPLPGAKRLGESDLEPVFVGYAGFLGKDLVLQTSG